MAFGAKARASPAVRTSKIRFSSARSFCRFTAEHVEQIDYKDVETLRDFIQENGKIMRLASRVRRRTTSVSSKPRSSAPASSPSFPTRTTSNPR